MTAPAGPSVRTVAFVGNGPVGAGAAQAIDGADWVVRFNGAPHFGGPAGRRVDDLFLVNVGGQPREWLEADAFWRSPHVTSAARVTLPVQSAAQSPGLAAARAGREHVDGINFEHDLRARLDVLGMRVRTLPDPVRRDAMRALGQHEPSPRHWPSTGFLALFWYDGALDPEVRFDLHGFGFAGARHHAWPAERAWAERRARAGRLRLWR